MNEWQSIVYRDADSWQKSWHKTKCALLKCKRKCPLSSSYKTAKLARYEFNHHKKHCKIRILTLVSMIRCNIRVQRWLTSSNCKAADLSNIALFVTVAFSSSMSTWWGWISTDRFYTPAYCHIILVASSSSWKFIVTIFTTFTAHHSLLLTPCLKHVNTQVSEYGLTSPSTHYK